MNKRGKSKYLVLTVILLAVSVLVLSMNMPNWLKKTEKNERIKELQSEIAQVQSGTKLVVQARSDWKFFFEPLVQNVTQKNPGSQLVFKQDTGSNQAALLMRPDAEQSEVCDLFAVTAAEARELAEKQLILPWDEDRLVGLLPQSTEFIESTGHVYRFQNELYACPWTESSTVLYVNYDHLSGINPGEDGQFNLGQSEVRKRFALPLYQAWVADLLLNGGGFRILYEAEPGKLQTDFSKSWDELAPEAQKHFALLYDYWRETGAGDSPFASSEKEIDATNKGFSADGDLAFRLGSPSDYLYLKSQVKNDSALQVYPLDSVGIDGKALTGTRSGLGLVINARVKGDRDRLNLIYQFVAELMDAKRGPQMHKLAGEILGTTPLQIFMDSSLSEQAKDLIAAEKKSYAAASSENLPFRQVEVFWRQLLTVWKEQKPENAKDAYEQGRVKFLQAGAF